MAAENQGQNGGSNPGVREQVRESAHHLQDEAARRYEAARSSIAHEYRQTEGMIARHPTSSVLIGFGVGFGLGVLLTAVLTQREESWYDRYVPDSLSHLPDRVRRMHLADRLRDLPESMASHLPDSVTRHLNV